MILDAEPISPPRPSYKWLRVVTVEWMQGPLGAKTLCNACGLRWAKRNTKRKTDEFGGVEGGGG